MVGRIACIALSFFKKNWKIHPDLCCWILIVKMFIWDMFRSQTIFSFFGQTSFIFHFARKNCLIVNIAIWDVFRARTPFVWLLVWSLFFLVFQNKKYKSTPWFLLLNSYCKIDHFGGFSVPNQKQRQRRWILIVKLRLS